jgi:hypothetical protein
MMSILMTFLRLTRTSANTKWTHRPGCSPARTARRRDRQSRAGECFGSWGAGAARPASSSLNWPEGLPSLNVTAMALSADGFTEGRRSSTRSPTELGFHPVGRPATAGSSRVYPARPALVLVAGRGGLGQPNLLIRSKIESVHCRPDLSPELLPDSLCSPDLSTAFQSRR